jgi:hypothetical protein
MRQGLPLSVPDDAEPTATDNYSTANPNGGNS